jgi:thiosulfate dehydrogenase [quinone] large subunit
VDKSFFLLKIILNNMEENKTRYVWGLLRLAMGLTFLWAFVDKVFGWGFATKPEQAWLAGGSPTTGFLQNAVHGPFVDFYHSLAGMPLVDWLFMLGLLFVGISLTFGVFVKLGSLTGIAMLFLMYTAVGIPPANHPFIDDHVVNILIMIGLMVSNSGDYLGCGVAWSRTNLVQKFKILK